MTDNPLMIMLINMTIVFGVLIAIGIMMMAIHAIDPTKKKPLTVENAAPVAAPAAAPAPVAVSNNDEIIAAITGAIVAMGFSSNQIASIRPVVSQSWKLDGRMTGRQ